MSVFTGQIRVLFVTASVLVSSALEFISSEISLKKTVFIQCNQQNKLGMKSR